ncbi:ABC transporter substrate-binding protein [bacterium]|nr:ABC transporter substrate-binding protein [bacterium]
MKRVIYISLILLVFLLFLKACIRKDVPEQETANNQNLNQKTEFEFPQKAKTVTINGTDYLQSQAPTGKFGGEVILSIFGEGPKTFNPFTSKDATSSQMAGMMFDGLFTTDAKTGEVIPKLAKKYELKGNDYYIYLRKGIQWSDGNPITADDVIFTWKNIIFAGLGNTSLRDSCIIDGKLPLITKIDDYTVKFSLPRPFAPFLRQLSAEVAPKHIFEPAVKQGAKYFDGFYSTTTPPEKFVTSGAFKLKEYKPAQRVVFVRNPNYYEINTKNEKLPYLNKVVYLIVGDANNEILKFEAKEIDVISLKGSNVARYKQKEPNADYKIYNIGPDTGTMFIVLNLNNRKNSEGKYYVQPEKQFWFKDKNFRYAIDYAIDRDNMVQNIANGLAEPLFTAESLNSIFLNKNIKGHKRDIDISREYLKQSGFSTNKNGKLIDKYGNNVEFDLYTNAGNIERESLGVMIKQDLEDLGMKINFKPIEFNTLVNKMVNTLDWDMILMGLTGSPLEPHNGKNVWNSYGSLHLFNQRLEKLSYDDRLDFEKQLDEIYDKASLETDFKARKALYDKYQQIIYDEKPIIYLYSPTRIIAVRKKLKNIYPSTLNGIMYNIEEIYLDK